MEYAIAALFFLAFTLLFYVLCGRIQERYKHLIEANIVPAEKKQRGFGSLFRHTGKNKNLIYLGLGLIGALAGLSAGIGVLGAAAGAIVGGAIPWKIAHTRELKRKKQLEAQVVPLLNLLSNSMKSGKTLTQAIEDVSNAIPKPMSEELSIIARQVLVGVQVDRALRDFHNRVNMPDIKLAVRSMIVSLKTGADLPAAMKQIGKTITERSKVEGKINTMVTQGKMQGLIMGAAPFVLMGAFYLFSPAYMGIMFKTVQGNILIGVMIVLQIIAYVMIQKIVTVRV